MNKIPRSDPRAVKMDVDLEIDVAGVRLHHRWLIFTARTDGRPQMSLVSHGGFPPEILRSEPMTEERLDPEAATIPEHVSPARPRFRSK